MNISTQQQLSQQMKLSPQMLQSLSFLAMNSLELNEYIYEEVQRNPALEVAKESSLEASGFLRSPKMSSENARLGSVSYKGQEVSDNFQAFLESRPQPVESLQEHLFFQYKLVAKTQAELDLGFKLVGNLDEKGFNRFPPELLLDKEDKKETPELLQHCLEMLHQLDPVGCATSGVEESLFVQAKLSKSAPPLALYILDGRISVLEKVRPAVVAKRLQELCESDGGLGKDEVPQPVTEDAVKVALDFIRSLEPFPARQFSSEEVHYIIPDVRVSRIDDDESTEGFRFKVELVRGNIPEVVLSPVYSDFAREIPCAEKKPLTESERQQRKFIRNGMKDAQWFLNALRQREDTIVKAALAIVHAQKDFFAKGPLYLAPLKMKDIANQIGVNESTISRLANGKYLQCDWGLFEIRYFFSSQVVVKNTNKNMAGTSALDSLEQNEPKVRSKESVKQELKDIIMQYAKENPEAKPLSDQKLSDLLGERGIQVARRTVAKYRGELNIESSFDRK